MKVVFMFILVIFIISIYTYNLKNSVRIQEKFDAYIDNVYCINLESNKERFYLLDSMAKNAKLSLTRFEAIDTRGDLYLQYQNIIHPVALEDMHQTLWRNKRIHEHGLTPGAIGCYLSHMSLYKEALNRGDKMIIVFEDDTQIPKNFKQGLLEKMKNLPENWDMFLLGWIPMGKENKLITQDLYHVHRFILMHAYVITEVGMRKMLNLCMPVIKKQVDHVVSDFSHTIHIYGTNPRGWIKQGSPSKNDAYRTSIQIPLLKRREVETFTTQSTRNVQDKIYGILYSIYDKVNTKIFDYHDKKHLIIIYENTNHPNAKKLKDMLRARGFNFVFIGKGDTWKGFGTKIHKITNYLKNHTEIGDDTYIVTLDARDVLINGTPPEFYKAISHFPKTKLIVGAERGCCTPATKYKMKKWQEQKSLQSINHKYLNAGMIAGTTKVFREIYPFDVNESDDDQAKLIDWWYSHPNDIQLDHEQTIFSNAHAWDSDFQLGCPYTIQKGKNKPIFIQTPAKYWKCYDKLYEKSKNNIDWFIV